MNRLLNLALGAAIAVPTFAAQAETPEEAKGADGKEFVKATIAAMKSSGAGQVDVRWGNPVTKQIDDAVMLSRRVPGHEAYVGTVIFK